MRLHTAAVYRFKTAGGLITSSSCMTSLSLDFHVTWPEAARTACRFLPRPKPPNEELGLVEHVVRDVEIKLSTFALLLTLPHARALPLSDDVGKYKLASAGMTMRSSLAAQMR